MRKVQGLWIMAGAAFLGILVFVAGPLKERKEKLQADFRRETAVLLKERQSLKQAEISRVESDKLFAPFIQSGTDEAEMSRLLSQLESLAGQYGLRVVEIKPQRVKTADKAKTFVVSLNLEGSLQSLIGFLYSAQAEPHRLGIVELNLESKLPQQEGLNVCRVDLSRLRVNR